MTNICRQITYEKPSDAKRRKMKKAQHNERRRKFKQECEQFSSFVDYIEPYPKSIRDMLEKYTKNVDKLAKKV